MQWNRRGERQGTREHKYQKRDKQVLAVCNTVGQKNHWGSNIQHSTLGTRAFYIARINEIIQALKSQLTKGEKRVHCLTQYEVNNLSKMCTDHISIQSVPSRLAQNVHSITGVPISKKIEHQENLIQQVKKIHVVYIYVYRYISTKYVKRQMDFTTYHSPPSPAWICIQLPWLLRVW